METPARVWQDYIDQAVIDSGWGSFKRNYFYASENGACPRRIYYNMLGTDKAPPKSDSYFSGNAGGLYHQFIQSKLSACFKEDLQYVETRLKFDVKATVGGIDYDFGVHGRLDGYLRSSDYIIEVKSMGVDAYTDFKRHGIEGRSYFKNYLSQGWLYSLGIEQEYGHIVKGVWIIPVCRETGDFSSGWTYLIDDINPSDFATMFKRWAAAYNAVDAGEPPDRPFTRKGFECNRFCDFGKMCWEDK